MRAIKCCKDCVAPKRHIGCHSVCPEYIGERAAYDEKQGAALKKKTIETAADELRWHSKAKYERRIGKKVV